MPNSKIETKFVKCQQCGFVFTVEVKETTEWMDTFEGCFTPPYCEQQYLRSWAEDTINAAINYAMGYTPQG